MAEAYRSAGEVIVVTGMSGAGRSTVANALEDLGWYVVDNLPPQMLLTLLDVTERAGGALPRVAVVVDVRGRDLFAELPLALSTLREGRHLRIVFLDASDAVLVRRFEAVRRPHPLQGDGTIIDGIQRERDALTPIREDADVVLDTSALNVHELASRVYELFLGRGHGAAHAHDHELRLQVRAAARRGSRRDMRFLPNPYWNPELRPLTGQDELVREYVLSREGAVAFLEAYAAALVPVLEGYQRENKRHAVLALGCTGGKHRSVVMAHELAARLAPLPGVAVRVKHRDLGRE